MANLQANDKEGIRKLFYAVLDEAGADMTRRYRALNAMAYEHFIGKDYLEHFDKAFEEITLRDYCFFPSITNNHQNFDFCDPVEISLQRKPYLTSIPQENVPYGGWFGWQITANHTENILSIKRVITDPTRTEPIMMGRILTRIALVDSTLETIKVNSEEEMLTLLRAKTLDALNQLSDFSKLNPEPTKRKEYYSPYLADSLKDCYRSSLYPPRNNN
jgi:hypothetical protein